MPFLQMAAKFIIFLASAAFIATSHIMQYKQTSTVSMSNFVRIDYGIYNNYFLDNSIVSDLQPFNITENY